jgi:hypothetical protein
MHLQVFRYNRFERCRTLFHKNARDSGHTDTRAFYSGTNQFNSRFYAPETIIFSGSFSISTIRFIIGSMVLGLVLVMILPSSTQSLPS